MTLVAEYGIEVTKNMSNYYDELSLCADNSINDQNSKMSHFSMP